MSRKEREREPPAERSERFLLPKPVQHGTFRAWWARSYAGRLSWKRTASTTSGYKMQIGPIQFTSVGKLVKTSRLKRNQCTYFYLTELIDELNPVFWWHRRLLTFSWQSLRIFLEYRKSIFNVYSVSLTCIPQKLNCLLSRKNKAFSCKTNQPRFPRETRSNNSFYHAIKKAHSTPLFGPESGIENILIRINSKIWGIIVFSEMILFYK